MRDSQAAMDGVERTLRVVEAVPQGRVLTYGDLSELAEHGGPRTAGAVMAHHGSGVPWHRVVSAQGRVPDRLRPAALARWRAEGTPLARDGQGVDLPQARWVPTPDQIAAGSWLAEPDDSRPVGPDEDTARNEGRSADPSPRHRRPRSSRTESPPQESM